LAVPFTFPITVASGATVTEITSPTSPDPEDANELGSFYLTDSPSGRVATEAALDRIVAGGVEVTTIIKYPEDIGLGAAGFGTEGPKKSEIVEIYSGSGDEVDDF
jgi:hypothetical protein